MPHASGASSQVDADGTRAQALRASIRKRTRRAIQKIRCYICKIFFKLDSIEKITQSCT